MIMKKIATREELTGKPKKICSVEECGLKHYAKGFCSKHYSRFLENGNPIRKTMINKEKTCQAPEGCSEQAIAKGYCQKHYIRFLRNGYTKLKKFGCTTKCNGYFVFKKITKGKISQIAHHRKIVQEFLGRKLSNKEVIHHINGNGFDNRLENLYLFNSPSDHSRFHRKPYTLISNLTEPMK